VAIFFSRVRALLLRQQIESEAQVSPKMAFTMRSRLARPPKGVIPSNAALGKSPGAPSEYLDFQAKVFLLLDNSSHLTPEIMQHL